MSTKGTKWKLIPCKWKGKCIHRTDEGRCSALRNADFVGECHFRKETHNGPFVWDEKQEGKNNAVRRS